MAYERGFRGRPKQVVKEEPVVSQKKPSSRTVSNNTVIPPQVLKNIVEEKRYEEKPAQNIPQQTYTKGQMLQKTGAEWAIGLHGYVQQRNIYQMRQGAIDPTQQYVMQTDEPGRWSKGQIVTGSQVKEFQAKDWAEYSQSYKGYQGGQRQTLKDIGGYPAGTTFTSTSEGYRVNIPEQEQLRFSETAIKQYEKLPPGLSNLALTGFYAGSNIASFGKGIADFIGVGKQYDVMTAWSFSGGNTKSFGELIKAQKYGVHYTSWGAYLPGGIKGETKILERHPVEAAIGNIGAEAAQFAGFTYAMKPVVAGGKFLLQTGVRQLPSFTRFVPIASRLTGRLGETTIGRNIGLFSKGYKPVTKGILTTTGPQISSRVVEGATTVTRVTRGFKFIPKKWYGFAEREFVPSSVSKNLMKPSAEITMIMRPSTKEATILFERTGARQSILGGWSRTYRQVKVTSRGGETYFESGLKGKAGSLYNIQNQKFVKPITESELALWHPKVQWLYEKVIPYQKGRGISIAAKQTSVEGTEATGSLIGRQIETTRLVSTSGRVLKPSGVSTFLPVSIGLSKIGELGAYTFIRGTSHEVKQIQQPSFIYAPSNRQQIYGGLSLSAFKSLDMSLFKSQQASLQIPKMKMMQLEENIPLNKQMKASAMRTQMTYNYTNMFYPYVPFGKGLTGGGWDAGFSRGGASRYKFREFKIPELKI